MKLALFFRPHLAPGGDPRGIVEVARLADEAGLHSVLFGDHLLMGGATDRYPYGTFRHGPDTPWLEPLTTLGAIAAVTRRIRLSCGVLLAPLRPAALLAKSIATLDVLSEGRVELGVGVGWQREEYDAQRLDWGSRRRRFDETIAACRAIWGAQPVSLDEPSVAMAGATCLPRPVQDRVPLLFGVAATPDNAARVARLGDGWMPVGTSASDVARGVALIRGAFADHGRDPSSLRVQVPVPLAIDGAGHFDRPSLRSGIDALAEAGATRVSVGPSERLDDFDAVKRLVHELAETGEER